MRGSPTEVVVAGRSDGDGEGLVSGEVVRAELLEAPEVGGPTAGELDTVGMPQAATSNRTAPSVNLANLERPTGPRVRMADQDVTGRAARRSHATQHVSGIHALAITQRDGDHNEGGTGEAGGERALPVEVASDDDVVAGSRDVLPALRLEAEAQAEKWNPGKPDGAICEVRAAADGEKVGGRQR